MLMQHSPLLLGSLVFSCSLLALAEPPMATPEMKLYSQTAREVIAEVRAMRLEKLNSALDPSALELIASGAEEVPTLALEQNRVMDHAQSSLNRSIRNQAWLTESSPETRRTLVLESLLAAKNLGSFEIQAATDTYQSALRSQVSSPRPRNTTPHSLDHLPGSDRNLRTDTRIDVLGSGNIGPYYSAVQLSDDGGLDFMNPGILVRTGRFFTKKTPFYFKPETEMGWFCGLFGLRHTYGSTEFSPSEAKTSLLQSDYSRDPGWRMMFVPSAPLRVSAVHCTPFANLATRPTKKAQPLILKEPSQGFATKITSVDQTTTTLTHPRYGFVAGREIEIDSRSSLDGICALYGFGHSVDVTLARSDSKLAWINSDGLLAGVMTDTRESIESITCNLR